MPHTNPWFSNTTGYATEVNLLDDLVMEQITMFGIDILYMPRKDLNMDKVLHESTKAAFEFAMPIPLFLKNFSGFNSGIELLTKFGVRGSDDLTFIMSRSHWEQGYAQFVKSYYHSVEGTDGTRDTDRLQGHTEYRPKEGDLIYFPFDDSLFEVKYVMFDQPFFQLGQGYVFELQCEKFEFSGEIFDTDYEEVADKFNEIEEYYNIEFELSTGVLTFFKNESVTIYNLADALDPDNPSIPDISEFRMYFNPGFLQGVPSIEGNITFWDKSKKILRVNRLTDVDPDTQDENKDVTKNKLDQVLIVGQQSGAIYVSRNSKTTESAFNDAKNLQNEFDKIQILDPADENPFGFV